MQHPPSQRAPPDLLNSTARTSVQYLMGTAGSSILMTILRKKGPGPLAVVLTHGYSKHVAAMLLALAESTHFTVLVAESQCDGRGQKMARKLLAGNVPVHMIEFGAISRCMAQVDLALCGASAVLADGSVLGQTGTLSVAQVAQAFGRPFYVAVPHDALLHARPVDVAGMAVRPEKTAHARIFRERPLHDLTPPQLITLLLTDVGALTASAVADEMIRVS